MLYHLHELGNAAMTPWRVVAQMQQSMLRHPWNPASQTTTARAVAAGWELLDSNIRAYDKPDFDLKSVEIDGERVAVTEEIVTETAFCDLLHFKRATKKKDPRLLIVAPLSGHYATLLRGTVSAMLPAHDVYITDWKDARLVPLNDGEFDLDDYVDCVMRLLQDLGPNTHVMAVCQPSVPVLVATALMAEDGDPSLPRSLTLMGGPVDTRRNPTTPNQFATDHTLEWFERTVVSRVPFPNPGFMRRVYPGFLQLSGFMSMNLDRHVGAHVRHFYHLVRGDGENAQAHRRFYDEYRAVMDLPAEYYLQTIDRVFQRQALARGCYYHRDRLVQPAAITKTGLMTIEGALDDISGVGQTRAAHDICTAIPKSWRQHYEQPGVGHYGVFNGRRWRQHIAPRVQAFIRSHDKKRPR